MNNNEQAMAKLAQVRMAINHVLRTRAMQKQATASDRLKDLGSTNGAVGISTPYWAKGMGGKVNKSRTMERYNKPENAPTSYFWPFNRPIKEVQDKTKRMTQTQTKNPEPAK